MHLLIGVAIATFCCWVVLRGRVTRIQWMVSAIIASAIWLSALHFTDVQTPSPYGDVGNMFFPGVKISWSHFLPDHPYFFSLLCATSGAFATALSFRLSG